MKCCNKELIKLLDIEFHDNHLAEFDDFYDYWVIRVVIKKYGMVSS